MFEWCSRRDWRVYNLELIDLVRNVNCDAIGNEEFWVVECNATAFIWFFELSIFNLGVCSAIDFFDCNKCEFDLRMLSSLCNACGLSSIRYLKEFPILDIVATTKCST